MFNFLFRRKNFRTKLIFIAPDINSGGAENILFNVAKTLNKKDIVLISLTDIGFYGSKLKNYGYEFYALKMKKNIFAIFKFIYLIILIYKYKPLIVHTWLYRANLFGGVAAKIAGVNKIYWTIHHDFEYSNFLMMLEMKILILFSYFIPKKIIFGSDISKKNHILNGYSKDKSTIINNGVSTKIFKSNKKFRIDFRKALGINEDCLVLGNIARYHPLKDHETLFKALQILKNKGLRFKCILIGSGFTNKIKKIKERINFYELNQNIIIYGQTFKINEIINAFDINILTSKKECSPISLLESMSTGVPCISTNVGDASQLIMDSGWTVQISDFKLLAELIQKIYIDKNIIKIKSKKARKRVEMFYRLEIMIEKYKALYF